MAQVLLLIFGILILLSAWFHQEGKLILFLKNLQGYLFSETFDPVLKKKFGRITDVVILAGFLLYAGLYFLGRWGGLNPSILVDKTGDAGALLSYAAALDAPRQFADDQILAPENQMFSYNGIYLPYIRAVARLTGDYGLAFLTLLPFCFFMQLTSFYLLGKELFKHRFWALLLSVLTAVPIVYGFWDSWGLAYDPLPRFLFQSLAPFFLLAAIRWSSTPKMWPWLMLVTSFMFFIHVISTPGIAFMLWVGFFLSQPKTWKLSKKVLFQLLNGLVFAIPFGIFVFLSNTTPGITTASGATYAEIMQYLKVNFIGFLDINNSLLLYLKVLNYYFLLIPAIFGIGVIYLIKAQHELRTNLIVIWLGACLVISILVPSLEHAIEQAAAIPPLQFDLVRNLRYSIPLLEIIGVSGFIVIKKQFANSFAVKRNGLLLKILVYLIAGIWVLYAAMLEAENDRKIGLDFAIQEINCLSSGKLVCPTQRQMDEAAALTFIRSELPIESTFLSMPNDDLANEIRYAGGRSVGFTRIDKNRIAYSHLQKAIEVEEISREWSALLKSTPQAFTAWAQGLSCEYAVTHWLVDDDLDVDLVHDKDYFQTIYQNGSFSVIKLPKCQ